MADRLIRLWRLLLLFFFRREPKPELAPVVGREPEPSPAESPKPRRARTRRRRADLRFKRDILDQLDDNTKIIGRMKAFWPDEYGLYSQIGAVIVPHDDPFLNFADLCADPISSWFNRIRPSFGAVVTGDPHDATKGKDEPMCARLVHFMKIEQGKDLKRRLFSRDHQTVQPIAPGSDLYIFTLYYDQRDWALIFPRKSRFDWKMCKFFERAFAVELPVEITKDGLARPLKIKRDKVFDKVGIAVKRWDYPYSKEYVAQLKLLQADLQTKLTPELFILGEVGFVLRCYEEANASMIQVRASKKDICTLINVNVEQTPEFFSDREQVIEDGIKKRIFHIVRAHERFLGNKTAKVRIHFRGLREFTWNGYAIEISVPGRDHLDIREFDVKAHERDGPDEADMTEVGAWLVANQKARFGAMIGKSGRGIKMREIRQPPEARP